MNSVFYLGIFILGSLLLPSSSGFVVEPLYGRNNFNLFSLLPFASTRVTQSQVTSILNRLTALETTNADLQNQILTQSSPRCTPSAISSFGAKIVSGMCVSVENPIPLKSFPDANTQCAAQGGVLAQPSFTNTNFFKQLKSAFRTKVAALATPGMYIGISAPATVATPSYAYLIGGAALPTGATNLVLIQPPPTAVNLGNACFVAGTPSATDLKRWLQCEDGTATLVTARGFICQYPVI